jgi:bifunctional UDP-N-acetylglucosamine pyrophosphorylase/glucosamine-1-phosphate N-acetyltransferase
MKQPAGMAIILAAGEGKRMRSDRPKVLHEAAGEPLLAYVGRAARQSGADRIVTVIGRGADRIRERFADEAWDFVVQEERRGTADAVRSAAHLLRDFDGEVVILAGDTPLLRGETLTELRRTHRERGASVTVLTARLEDPTGYGRILRDGEGEFVGIVEHKDATEEQRAIDEVNSSVYCFDAPDLLAVLDRITNDNAQGEYYLTDAVRLLKDGGKRVVAIRAASPHEILGVNDREQLREVERILAGEPSGDDGGHS